MSMISALIDELNKSADEWNGSNMFELARMCREAADTIWQLRDDLQRTNAENAKLRELLAEMDNRGGSMHIGEATVTVKPTLNWSGVAQELRAIADTLAGDAS